MRNIATAICIMLLGVLILVYGFKFQLYNVLSDSEAPYFVSGDMVVAREQKEYYVGDIIKFTFNTSELPVTHRLVGVFSNNGVKYYVCHGDNVGSANPANNGEIVKWEDDAEYMKSISFEEVDRKYKLQTLATDKKMLNVQIIKKDRIDGKVLFHVDNVGDIVTFIKTHTFLLITIVLAVWCVTATIQNELETRRNRRLGV